MKALLTTLAALALVAAIVVIAFQAREIQRLKAQLAASNASSEQASARLASASHTESAPAPAGNAASTTNDADKSPKELLKLRGEVGRLRVENASIASTNAISKITANPESRKMLRNQQKMGMGMIYKGFAKTGNLTTDQTEKLNDLLADHVMDNVDHVTQVLRDKPGADQMNQVFATEESRLQQQIKDLLGDDGLSQFQDYNRNLLSTLTAEQFKGMLSGTDDEKAQKTKQLLDLMKEQAHAALADANLPDDYQLVPILNFRNIASEQDGDRSLSLLESIYNRVAAQAGGFLSPDDLKKFEEFRSTAISNNRMALNLNRTLMAPISQ